MPETVGMPIQPDIVGRHLHLTETQHVKLTGPDELAFAISEKPS